MPERASIWRISWVESHHQRFHSVRSLIVQKKVTVGRTWVAQMEDVGASFAAEDGS
jgi:hypothetical protein